MKKNIFLLAVLLGFTASNFFAFAETTDTNTTVCPGKGAICKKSNGWITINDEKDKNGPSIVITF